MPDLSALLAVDTAVLAQPDMILRLILQVFLFCCSAFFSMSETALFSVSPVDLRKLARTRHPQADRLQSLLREPRQLIISILCGNELINIAATINLASILLALYGSPDTAALVNIVLMFPLLLLFGEVTPKTLAVTNPVKISTGIVAQPLSNWVRIIAPLRLVIRAVADRITTLIVGDARAGANILRVDEFRTLLRDVESEGVLNRTERVLIDNLIKAGETEILSILTPRPRVPFIDGDQPVPAIVEAFRSLRCTHAPVYRGHRDTLIGFLHADDVIRRVRSGADLSTLSLEELLRPPIIVPPTKTVEEMFDYFKTNDRAAAAVVNEFGGVDGFITVNDILDFIFGSLSETVLKREVFTELQPRIYEIAGQVKLKTFFELTGIRLQDERMTTLGGVVFRHLDRLPEVGDRVTIDGITFHVLEMEGCLVKRLLVGSFADEPEDEETDDTDSPAEPVGDANVPASPAADARQAELADAEISSGTAAPEQAAAAAGSAADEAQSAEPASARHPATKEA